MITGMPGASARGLSGARFRARVTGSSPGPGTGHAVLVPGVALLRPEEQVLEAMLARLGRPAGCARPGRRHHQRPAGADTGLHRSRGVPAVAVDGAAVRGVVR